MDYSNLDFPTRQIHEAITPDPLTGAILTPIHQSTTGAILTPIHQSTTYVQPMFNRPLMSISPRDIRIREHPIPPCAYWRKSSLPWSTVTMVVPLGPGWQQFTPH